MYHWIGSTNAFFWFPKKKKEHKFSNQYSNRSQWWSPVPTGNSGLDAQTRKREGLRFWCWAEVEELSPPFQRFTALFSSVLHILGPISHLLSVLRSLSPHAALLFCWLSPTLSAPSSVLSHPNPSSTSGSYSIHQTDPPPSKKQEFDCRPSRIWAFHRCLISLLHLLFLPSIFPTRFSILPSPFPSVCVSDVVNLGAVVALWSVAGLW